MMKFFRRIRKKMLQKGKARNYLFYALGEIGLVVIGILIALQINTWNEAYKDSRLENTYYCKLLDDLNQDQTLLQALIKDNEQRIASANMSIHLLQQEKVNRKELVNVMRESINKIRFNFKPSLSAFDDLKSSGKITILSDAALKKRLLNYYAVQTSYGDILDIVADASLNAYMHPSKQFEEIGFHELDFVRAEIDTTLVNLTKLRQQSPLSAQTRKQLLNEAILHLNTNARKKSVYKTMENEILSMKTALEKKCFQE